MRAIEFRAKGTNGKWVYGLPLRVHGTSDWCIAKSNEWTPTFDNPDEGEETVFIKIDVDTLCQFTGLMDCDGNHIYEGDILHKDGYWDVYVMFSDGCFKIVDVDKVRRANMCTNGNVGDFISQNYIVTGNIYDKNK